jgi:elongation factor Ts
MGKAAAVLRLSLHLPAQHSLSSAQIEDVRQSVRESLGHKLAMHVVASRPQYVSAAEVPQEVVDKEMEIFREQMKDEKKKKPEILEGIMRGKLNKRLAEICLLDQAHVAEEGAPQISKFLDTQATRLGLERINVKSFHLWTLK